MDPELNEQIERLQRIVDDFAQASRRALGFAHTIEYQGIRFLISRQMVVADLTPLGYLQLVETFDSTPGSDLDPHFDAAAGSDATPEPCAAIESAVRRLHHRIVPLLLCQHDWIPLRRADDYPVRRLERPDETGRAYTCKLCTAYAFGDTLPTVGRG
jgi:hypothetical protein